MTLAEFDEWLAVSSWDDSNVADDTLQLVRNIRLILAEFSSGAWTWPEVQRELQLLSQYVRLAWGEVVTVRTGTSGSFIQATAPATPSVSASIRFEAVCV